ncbi:tRNA (guanosine(46)-N7)-methyltransferase TrmB [Silanimonas sp.]|uniref:tRNA (guanosine(46)-N7)-methyltransferase TrmB n=1 Tax=Silanimonas sp. TaxID=1929290 RepID=UPI0037C6DF97
MEPKTLKKPFTEVPGQRQVRSFVLRQGRLTQGQERALEDQWPRFGLDYASAVRDFDAAFGRSAPLVLEIGFGNGEQLLFAAQNEPEKNLVGLEVHAPGVGRLLQGAAELGVTNLKAYCHDAVEVLHHEVADASVDELRIYFPDPWHKKRHHKRRLVQPEFVALLARKLKPGGLLHLATDWEDYARQMLEVCGAEPALRNRTGVGGTIERPQWRRQTHFETRGLKLGHGVWDLLFERIG